MTGWGVLFSGWLTYLELFVIDAICMWCVVSAHRDAGHLPARVLDKPWREDYGERSQ